MLGYYACIQLNYRIGLQQVRSALVCDVMTHSKARGMGVFTKLGAYSLEHFTGQGIQLTLGYPVRPEVFPGHYKVGWKKAFDLPVYLRLLRPSQIFKNTLLQKIFCFADWVHAGDRVLWTLFAKTLGAKPLSLEPVSNEAFARAFASGELVLSAQKRFSNYLEKTPEFWSWRLAAPETSYDRLFFRDSQNNIVGWAVGRRALLKGFWFWSLLDFHLNDSSWATQTLAWSKLSQFVAGQSVVGISTMMSRFCAKSFSLRSNFFVRMPFKFSIIYKLLDSGLTESALTDESRWNLMWIETDDL